MRLGNGRRWERLLGAAASAWLAWTLAGVGGAARAADRTKAIDEKVADIARTTGLGRTTLEGVGLVVGLSGTGSDPKPSAYRERIKTEIQRNPDLDADGILGDPRKRVAMVLVRATIIAGMTPEDELNVEILLPPGSETTSLSGGFLMETWLYEGLMATGGTLEGKKWVKAVGPIITGTAEDPTDEKAGRVLGGGRIKEGLPYYVFIDSKHRSGMVAKQLEDLINYRFQYRDGRFKKGVATAKTDNRIELRVPDRYHQNQLRFVQVLSQLRLRTTPALLEQRKVEWAAELLDPQKAGVAALKLEGLGAVAIPELTAGLESEHPQVRFFAAEALAYLDDPAGTEALARTAIEYPEFRPFALTALAAMDQPAGILRLRELMSETEPSVRYGAFNALRTSDPTDPFLGRVRVLGLLEERRAADPMAMQVGDDSPTPSKAEPLPPDPFELYVVRSDGPPMVHVSRNRRREVVLFGAGQELMPPVVLGGIGPVLLNANANDERIEVSAISLSGRAPQVMVSSTDLAEVIRTAAALGATYPQIVTILEGADAQANLTASLAVDALPNDFDSYDAALIAGTDITKRDEAVKAAAAMLAEEQRDDEAPRRFDLFGRLRSRFAAPEEEPAPRDDALKTAEYLEPIPETDAEPAAEDAPPAAEPDSRPGILGRLRDRLGDRRTP